jgi:hypothetical protein
LKRCLGFQAIDHISKDVIYGNDVKPISDVLRRTRLLFIGHCLRARDHNRGQPVSDLILWRSQAKRRRGQSRTLTYVEMVEAETGLSADELTSLAQDRSGWRELVDAVAPE